MTEIGAYTLGRIIAVVETITDTPEGFAGMAVRNPADKLTYHFVEACKNPGEYEGLLSEVICATDVNDVFPSFLPAKEAGIVWTGYYQQMKQIEDSRCSRKMIGEKIRDARKAAGLTQEQVAKMARITRPNLSDLENGKYNASIDILSSVCNVLGLEINLTKVPICEIPESQIKYIHKDIIP